MSTEMVKVEGLGKLNRQLKALDAGLEKEVSKINFEAAMIVAKAANSYVPVRSGRLARSIRAGATKTRATVRAGGKSVPYAAPIHWGWARHNITPQPFLYEALDSRRPEVFATYERQVAALVERAFHGGAE